MNIFNFIKSHISIVDVVGEYTTLKKAGNYLKSRCPFHHEKTASFSVSPIKEIYYCFGCHAGGDVISFIAKIENCSQLEAAKFLADRYNLSLPDEAFDQGSTTKQKHYYDICHAFALWAHEQLEKHPSILHYLHHRHINNAMINQFKIGYMPGGLSSVNQMIHAFKKDHILVDDLLESQILLQGKTMLYSPFEDRILFPIADHLGRFCGFGGRTYKPQDQRPKYYNSRENNFFTKGAILFGLDIAKKEIQQKGAVFLVEGYTDCIAMAKYGYTNTVATLGTACTIAHLKLLSRYANYVYLLYDADKAGQEAVLRLTQLCWHANMELKVVHLPMGQDPASYLSAGNNLEERIDNAEDIFTFFINTSANNFPFIPLAEKLERIRTFLEIIRGITEPLKQDLLLQTAARAFDVPFSSLKQELSSNQPNVFIEKDDELADKLENKKTGNSPSILEKRLFCAIINRKEFFNTASMHYIIDIMTSPLKNILRKIINNHGIEKAFDFSQIFDTLDQDDKQYVSKLLMEYDEPMEDAQFHYLRKQYQKEKWKQIIRAITIQLQQAQKNGDKQLEQEILQDYNVMKNALFTESKYQIKKEN